MRLAHSVLVENGAVVVGLARRGSSMVVASWRGSDRREKKRGERREGEKEREERGEKKKEKRKNVFWLVQVFET